MLKLIFITKCAPPNIIRYKSSHHENREGGGGSPLDPRKCKIKLARFYEIGIVHGCLYYSCN